MAKNYAEMSTEELQKLAEDQKNRRAAIRELAQSGADPSILSSLGGADRQAFLKEREQKRVDDWHAANDKARADRLKGMLGTEGGRYSPVTIANARKYLEENGYGQEGERRREFDVTNETTRKVSENEMNGKINYGKGAAEVKAGADVTMNKNEWETRAKIAEQEAAARKYLADQDAAVKRDISKNRDGWWDDQGNFHPGASVKEAEAGGTWRLEQQKLKNQGNADVQELKNKGTETQANATVEAARERQKGIGERRAQQDALREQKDFETWIANQTALDPSKRTITSEEANQLKTMPIEEQKEFWKQKTGRQDGQQNDVVTDSKGTKWQVIYDENGKPVGKKPIK